MSWTNVLCLYVFFFFRTPDETTVKKTVNSRLSDMYAKQPPRTSNATDNNKKNSDPEVVVMDDDDNDEPEISEVEKTKATDRTSEEQEQNKSKDCAKKFHVFSS